MSPVATAQHGDLLEHTDQAFDAYRADEVTSVLCEEKHMGSRAVLLVCRSPDDARARFGLPAGSGVSGTVWTRTGRPFFAADPTAALIDQVRAAIEKAGLFAEIGTSWLLLDAELLPWNVKAGPLLRDQYAAVGAAARASLPAAASALEQACARDLPGVGALLDRTRSRRADAEALTAAPLPYRLATDRPGPPRRAAVARHPRPRGAQPPGRPRRGSGSSQHSPLVQPGLKVRGREYLRLIYGPDYTEPPNLARLRQRALSHKRSLALREYALGLEALDRVARGEPLWRVHECVFAGLALGSEPVEPRL